MITIVETVRSRGQGPTTGPAALDAGPFGGAIWFNSAVNWHFGLPGSPPPPGRNDFLTTAVHELFHLLGFGDSDAFRARISDDGRFFLGPDSQRVFGGPVPLDRFASHFAEGTLGLTARGVQETLMDPSTPAGIRQLPTDLDFAVLSDIGWEVTPMPIPVPSSLWLLGTTTVALMRFGSIRVARRQAAV